jgi:hypothetical protein
MTSATKPTVTRVVATFEHDSDCDPFDMRSRFHWERFGREVEIDDSEYVAPFRDGSRHRFDFDDEDHPIYTLQRGAKLVIEDSMRYSADDRRPVAERLAELADDAKHIRTWLQDQWHYVNVHVEVTIQTTVDGIDFEHTEDEWLGGVEDGLGGLDSSYTRQQEQAYHDSTIADMVAELKARVTAQGVEWPDDIEVERE